MKKLFILLTCSCIALGGFAQDDDVYFVPQKSKKTNKAEYIPVQQNDDAYSYTNEIEYDNWADGIAYSEEDIDAYNRRYQNDTTNIDTMNAYTPEVYAQDEYTQGTYTARLVRFHSPRAGIIVSSPYYVDYYDLWGSPWYYDTWYGSPYWYGHNWYYSSWYWGWGYNCWDWYWGWGCPNYWWGHHHHHYYPHYPHYPHYPNYPHYASGNRGPHGGWVDRYRTNSGSKYASNNRTNNVRNTRGYSSNYRPSREFGNRNNNSSRSDVNKTNNNRYQNSSTTTRQFGNSNRTTTTTRTTTNRSYDNSNSNRSYNSNSTNRSYNSTSSYSRSYSTGAGSSRSFGGGGGARGGRR